MARQIISRICLVVASIDGQSLRLVKLGRIMLPLESKQARQTFGS
jgi:hypothetical protein